MLAVIYVGHDRKQHAECGERYCQVSDKQTFFGFCPRFYLCAGPRCRAFSPCAHGFFRCCHSAYRVTVMVLLCSALGAVTIRRLLVSFEIR
jgi:hypothetical protein